MTEVPPGARAVVSALADAPTAPAKILVTGGIGTGKTTTLAAVRQALRAGGVTVASTPPSAESPAAQARVIDDADLLSDAELEALTELAQESGATVVVAFQPREQRAALRALATAIERESARVALGPLPRIEVVRRIDTHEPELITAIMAATAGIPFLIGAVQASDDIGKSTFFALVQRLRRVDEAVLDALLIASLTPGLGPADVAAALDVDVGTARDLVDRAHATGLLDPSLGSQFLSTVHRAVAQVLGAARHLEIETALLRSQLEISTLSTDLALQLAEHGMREPRLVAALKAAARRPDTPRVQSVRMYRAAIAAGGDDSPDALAVELADALALVGDCTDAAAVADGLLGAADPATRAAAVRVAAAVAAHDGNSAQAAELFAWLGPDAGVSAPAALVFAATGDARGAREVLRVQHAGPPTSSMRATRNLAEGLVLTLDQPYAVAMARLGQSIDGQSTAEAVPDSPAAVVALAAMHAGDPVRARSVLARAVRGASIHPDPVFDHRHRLLQAWLRMQDGQLQASAADAAVVPDQGLHRRDALWRAALQTGLARRNGDTGALQHHWYAAMEVLAEYSVDLFSLLPLGELWIAAARMRQEERLAHPLNQAFALLTRLGDPPSWSLPLHWAGVHAAILANAPEAMAPHGQALTAAAADSGFARALAAAGRSWLRVLANQIDVATSEQVAAAARGLSQFGLTWDATRLAGQAALQTPDPRVSAAMLQVARDLKLSGGQDLPDEASETSAARVGEASSHREPEGAPTPSGSLSEREREVAELLLLGMPYRDIGAQLFISAKTVEHHVARIRRRLGAESRSEMLSMLRAMLAPQG